LKKQQSPFSMVSDFHEAFRHPISHVPVALTSDRKQKRSDWLQEEIDEFKEAGNLVDQVDALIIFLMELSLS
jgi:predicted HAD superfamily Cof-like phosphohydrolase